jgi:kinesin family protein 5
MARFRPVNTMEQQAGGIVGTEFLTFSQDCKSIKMGATGTDTSTSKGGTHMQHVFSFDYIFPPDATQVQLFDECAKGVVDDVLKGFNGTIFAYGQTGSGKTYSMFGQSGNEGVIPRAVNYVFEELRTKVDCTEGL